MTPRKKLLALEAKGQFLFHGSPFDLEKLTPTQSYNWDRKTGEKYEDGKPAVAATDIADIAIFRALTHKFQFLSNNQWCGTSFGLTPKGEVRLEATPGAWEELEKGKTGYVYVILRKGFANNDKGWDWRSRKEVKPIEVIKITSKDLDLQNIKVVKNFFEKGDGAPKSKEVKSSTSPS
jgi:hypothetical protein